MSIRKIASAAEYGGTIRARILLGATALALALAIVPAGVSQANWYYTKSGHEKLAKDFVSKHYANTYVSNLITRCERRGGGRLRPGYKYHVADCWWGDKSDGSYGLVRITGSTAGPGAYYGVVLRGARRA